MVGIRALGLLQNDPQRGHLALHTLAELAALPTDADAIGIATLVDGAPLLTRQPTLASGATLATSVGPMQGRCTVVQVRIRSELSPGGGRPNAEQIGPFRARSYAAAVVGGPQDADAASSSRERLLAGVPDFLRRFVDGHHEGEAFFIAVLHELHQRGGLDVPHANGMMLAQATRAVLERAGSARHVVVTNGNDVVHAAWGMPAALVHVQGISEALAAEIEPTLVDSSISRERLRRFRSVVCIGGLESPLRPSTAMPSGCTLELLAEGATVLVQRDLVVKQV